MRTVSPVDAAWLVLESRDTPMHVGGLFEFTLPPNAPADYLNKEFARRRAPQTIPPPWNLRLVDAPLLGARLPLMREIRDVDLDYHIRHSALPHPGGQRELGVLVSRLHSHQLDLHRPLWEVHLIEGLEGNRFAIYSKMHHSLVDGVSGMRLIMRTLSRDPKTRNTPVFRTVGAGDRPLTAGIPVNLRDSDDQSMGTAIGFIIAELGTNVANPMERLRAIRRSTAEAKKHLSRLPNEARTSYTLLMNAPYIAGLALGL